MSNDTNFGTFGDFFGGMLNPILTFLTFMGLLITIVLQQKELRLTRKELKESSLALTEQSLTLAEQLKQSRKTTNAEFFFRAMYMMQDEQIRDARSKAYELSIEKKIPFIDWTTEDERMVEKVCYTYDVVGMMIRNGLVEESYILPDWHISIKKSWQCTKELVKSRRGEDGDTLWRNYEWLNSTAQKY